MANEKEDLLKEFEQYEDAEEYIPLEKKMEEIPSKTVRQQIEEPIKAATAGLAMGATLGFGEEALAANKMPPIDELVKKYPGLKEYLEFAHGKEIENIGKTYPEIRDVLRKKYKEISEEYPAATTLGELVGAAAIPAGPLTRTLKDGKTFKEALKRLTKTTTEGTMLGSLYGLGQSEADLTKGEYEKALEDIKYPALIGAAIPTALATPKVTKKIAEEIPGLKEAFEAFEEGRKGYQIFNRPLVEHKTMVSMQKIAENVAEKVGEEGKKIPEILKKATEEGKKISPKSIDDTLDKITKLKKERTTDEFLFKELDTLETFLKDFKSGEKISEVAPEGLRQIKLDELNPEQMNELKKTLQKITVGRKATKLQDPQARELANELVQQLKGQIEEVAPGYQKQLESVSRLKSALESASLVGKGKTKEKALEQTEKKLFREASKTTGEGPGAAEARFDIRNFFKSLKEVDPELAAKIEPKFRKQVKQYELASGVGDQPLQTSTPRGLIGSLSALTTKASGVTGYYGARNIDKLITKLTPKGKIAQPLISTLEKLKNKDLSTPTRNALIFKIAQDPSSRELLQSVEVGEEELKEFEKAEEVK